MIAADRIGDPADQAQLLEELERAEGVRAIAAELARSGASHCLRCGDAIAEARRAALPSTTHCLDCREEAEFTRRITGAPNPPKVEILRGRL